MSVQPSLRWGSVPGALLTLLAGCGELIPTGPGEPDARPVLALVTPTPAQVIVAGPDLGSFTSPFVANNSGRPTTEFWDNLSADNSEAVLTCNIGFYATGTQPAGCQNEAPGSTANQGGYSGYWGDGPGTRDPSSFMFNGAYSYQVTLLGSYAGEISEVGWFTKSAGVYTFNPIPAWTGKVLNTTITISTGGIHWGFYIRNSFNPETGGCNPPEYDCSDATGGFTVMPFQQFALFVNQPGTSYLVGAEDNKLETMPNGFYYDSDYNDYIFRVVPDQVDVPEGGQGCSPGYWKNHKFPTGYSKTQLFGSVFDNAFPGKTLQQVLQQGGGGLTALGRQTVSALLNAKALGSKFDLTHAQVIAEFNAVFPGTPKQYEALKDRFEKLTDINGRRCPNPTGK